MNETITILGHVCRPSGGRIKCDLCSRDRLLIYGIKHDIEALKCLEKICPECKKSLEESNGIKFLQRGENR